VQLDYNLPSKERFDLEYIGADNAKHQPVMIHRAPLGSLERFVGVLIEHFAGAFPLWLAPEQVRVIPVSEKSEGYAQQVKARLEAAGLRVGLDLAAEKLGAKIRTAQLELIPMMVVCGPRDEAAGTVSLRDRVDGDLGAMSLEAAREWVEVYQRLVNSHTATSLPLRASLGGAEKPTEQQQEGQEEERPQPAAPHFLPWLNSATSKQQRKQRGAGRRTGRRAQRVVQR
jgi:threonyl-tRNA synthetase